MEPYLSELHRGPQRTTLVRFRLGQHWLYTRIGCFGPHRMLYDSRWCQICALSAQCLVVDSEEHAIFHCPLYDGIRHQQPRAQHQGCCDLQAFMRLSSLQQARFLHACYECHLGTTWSPVQGQRRRRGRIRLLGVRQHIPKGCTECLLGQLALHFCLPVQLAD